MSPDPARRCRKILRSSLRPDNGSRSRWVDTHVSGYRDAAVSDLTN